MDCLILQVFLKPLIPMKDYMPSRRGGDCGYAGNVVLEDGTFVLTSY